MPFVLVAIVLALLFHGGSCMPGDPESGAGVLLATPFFTLVNLAILRGLLALWRAARPELGMRWLPGLCAVWGSFVLGLAAAVYLGVRQDGALLEEVFGLGAFAFCLVGGLHLGVTLLVWRLWLWRRPASAFTWAWLPPLLLVLPAIPMAAGVTDDWMDGPMAFVWIVGGFFGVWAGVLFLIGFLIEAGVRRARARRAQRAASAAGL